MESGENKRMYTLGIKNAVQLFLDDKNKDKELVLDPVCLNSFLKTMEVLREKLNVKLEYNEKGYAHYVITKE